MTPLNNIVKHFVIIKHGVHGVNNIKNLRMLSVRKGIKRE
jgi:hypothetical protein